MKASRTVVVMPVGPTDDAMDTIDSLLRFADDSLAVVVVDDSRGSLTGALTALGDPVTVVAAPLAVGNRGGLWVKIASGYRYVLENFDFKVILRLDADSLVIGPLPDLEAIDRFEADRTLGMLGAYRISARGEKRDFSPVAKTFNRETGFRTAISNGRLFNALCDIRNDALGHGYVSGEHCLGAAYFHRAGTVRAMGAKGWLDNPGLVSSQLADDHLFSVMTVAAGYRLGDFAGPGQPLGVQWIGLPYPVSELVERGFRIVHSVRGPDEANTRSFFRQLREAGG